MDITYQLPTIDNRLAKKRIGVVLEHITASAMTVVESNDVAGEEATHTLATGILNEPSPGRLITMIRFRRSN
jgi:hypothetical protein